ncbi:MAG: TlyA family RNA methyltransferase [Clostridia bacterium]|nr:TlyA family RNA methyltransferase [Clostridia bacterium]
MRLDKFLAEKYGSRTKASAAVSKGLVKVNGKISFPAYEVKEGDDIQVAEEEISFVSAGGYKLYRALNEFGFDVKDKIFADIGASTGGFTDCLLLNGAKKVYCIDVGESQLAESLKDKNVVIIDNYNARNLNKELFSEQLDGAVVDVSFISLTYILQHVSDALTDNKHCLALIKPQFECESKNVGKNGIVKGDDKKRTIIKKIYDFALSCNLAPQKLCYAPIIKGKNTEFVILLEKGGKEVPFNALIKSVRL